MRSTHWQDAVNLNAIAPPFHRNPSAWPQRIPICVLAGIATVIASYMALFQWGLIASVWDPLFGPGSERVLTSQAAKTMDGWLHIPDAAFGAWGYLSEMVLGLVGVPRVAGSIGHGWCSCLVLMSSHWAGSAPSWC